MPSLTPPQTLEHKEGDGDLQIWRSSAGGLQLTVSLNKDGNSTKTSFFLTVSDVDLLLAFIAKGREKQ
jgi:hypothetical protein